MNVHAYTKYTNQHNINTNRQPHGVFSFFSLCQDRYIYPTMVFLLSTKTGIFTRQWLVSAIPRRVHLPHDVFSSLYQDGYIYPTMAPLLSTKTGMSIPWWLVSSVPLRVPVCEYIFLTVARLSYTKTGTSTLWWFFFSVA